MTENTSIVDRAVETAAKQIADELGAKPSRAQIERLMDDLTDAAEPTISNADFRLIRETPDHRARTIINHRLAIAFINGRTEGIRTSTVRICDSLDRLVAPKIEEDGSYPSEVEGAMPHGHGGIGPDGGVS